MIYNGYTESEICMLYRDAKNKKLQIEILTQLTGLRPFQVERILEEGGYLNQMTDLVKERILQLYKDGLSDKAIGKELSVAQSQVSKFLRDKGLPPNGKKFPKKIEIQEDKEMLGDIKESVNKVSQETLDNLKREAQENYEALKDILPTNVNATINYVPVADDIVETLTPQQYYELAKLSLELLKTIWG